MYYTCTDYLGSITALVNASGVVVEEYNTDAWGKRRNPNDWSYTSVPIPVYTNRCYTGHEHLDDFGLINMNARLYDPTLGRMLSPDNYIQAPDFTQSYNRYSYAWNNPTKYTDPDGNFVFLPIILMLGAGIGAIQGMNTAVNNNVGGLKMMAYTLGGAAIGLASSYAGYAAGTATAAAAATAKVGGFAAGFATGFAGGATGGFVSGAGNSWMYGGSFVDGLQNGFQSAAIGGALGGVAGGIIGGVSAVSNSGNFWDGSGEISAFYDDGISENLNNRPIDFNNQSAKEFSNDNYGENPMGVRDLCADGSAPVDKRVKVVGDQVFYKGKPVSALTQQVGRGSKLSDVYLFKNAFTSSNKLFMVMGHEYLHAGFDYLGFKSGANDVLHHEAIYKWEAMNARYSPEFFLNRFNSIPHTSNPYNYKLIFPNAR